MRNALGHCGTLCGTCWNLRLSAKKSLDFTGLQGQQAAATVIAILRRRPLRSLGLRSEGLLFPTRTCIKATIKQCCKSCLPRQSTACTEVGQCASKIRSHFGIFTKRSASLEVYIGAMSAIGVELCNRSANKHFKTDPCRVVFQRAISSSQGSLYCITKEK